MRSTLRVTVRNFQPIGMPKAKGKLPKWYAVRIGRRPGVYETWSEADKQVGQFPGAVHQSFKTKRQAESWLADLMPPSSRQTAERADGCDVHRPLARTALLPKASAQRKRTIGSATQQMHPRRATSPIKQEPAASAAAHAPAEPDLTPEQARILDRIVQGENFFFTGSAGTGKSVLLRAIIREFHEQYEANQKRIIQERNKLVGRFMAGEVDARELTEFDMENGVSFNGAAVPERWKLSVTASTGMASINIGGCTLHSWAGVGLGKLDVEKLCANILRDAVTRDRWKSTSALIIDEISMIDGNLLDKLDQIARKIRNDPKPFGGIQVIACGDFHQLPPVPDREGPATRFAFQAACWDRLFGGSSGAQQALRTVFRQKEGSFVKLLERMRKGKVTPEDIDILAACQRQVKYNDDVEPVGLYAKKSQVERLNLERLSSLDAEPQEYTSYDTPGVNSRGYEITAAEATALLDRNTLSLPVLTLKVGAQVMLIANMQDGTLVNGSTGVVADFLLDTEAAEQGIYLPQRARASDFNREIRWPVVEFAAARHAKEKGCVRALIPSMTVDCINALGTKEASRLQIPLILSWAMTVHKSQGQSIDRLKVDLAGTFETGQAYVALSRATSLETLEIQNFHPQLVMAHPKVIEWSRPFEEEQAADEEWDSLLKDACLDY